MLALFGSLDALRRAKDCSAGGAIDSWLSMGALISIAERGIAPSEERNTRCVLNSRPLRRAQGCSIGGLQNCLQS